MQASWSKIACALVLSLSFNCFAQYPDRPVRLVVPWPPGGGVDIAARTIQQGLTENLKQPVVIDNRGGAGGTIGTAHAAKSPADGYTLLMASSSTHAVAPSLYKNLPYDPIRDFAPVSFVETKPYLLVVHPSMPARNVKELIAVARASKIRLTMASAGTGSSNHLVGELFQLLAGVKFIHVPYKGTAPAGLAVISGECDLLIDQLAPSLPHIQAGKLRALAITMEKRSPQLPQVMTLRESGITGGEAIGYTALVAPAGTPPAILERLNAAVVSLLKSPAIVERFANQGSNAYPTTPEQVTQQLRADLAKWATVIARAGVKVD
ncbi:MAG: tripartite tricarboxylate transporter substrate binding protein [Betaproteobacteria bacterium]|nr:tripartite tricarboxylate transporter substrate binding protein [Betaproteobacteria bacterium]MBI2224012.1 tripartite tricarboxylate transporter substrate binding protein [Betaproteobacteria bacterium]